MPPIDVVMIDRKDLPEAGEGFIEAAGRAHGFTLDTTEHPWGCDYFVDTGRMMPVDALDCREPCCAGAATRSMSDYIDRGLRRQRRPPLPIVGARCRDEAARFARFSLRVEDGVITEVAFDATVCATLVAYCEVAAERVTGLTVAAAVRRIRPHDLTRELPVVPPLKRDRALLAARALVAALVLSARSIEHEGRVHLCNSAP